MPTNRSYTDACPIARALDVLGERWALLVVRELLLAPRRFSDVRRGLPGASSNLIADRLRELEAHGVVRRRRLPPPAGSWVYELTDRGRRVESVLFALGDWGAELARPPEPFALSAASVLLYLRGAARPDPAAPPATLRIQLGDDVWTVRTGQGRVEVEGGEPARVDASLVTDPHTFNAFLADPAVLDGLPVTGDRAALRRLAVGADPVNATPAR
jgi:DNA-binding HxlR family transcriptional regulator